MDPQLVVEDMVEDILVVDNTVVGTVLDNRPYPAVSIGEDSPVVDTEVGIGVDTEAVARSLVVLVAPPHVGGFQRW